MLAYLTYGVYRVLGELTGRMPPRMGYWVAGWMGTLIHALLSKVRRTVTHNIRHVLGPDASESEVRACARRACVNIAKCHYDLFRLEHRTADEIREMAPFEGREHLDQALAKGKGVVLIAAHVGNVDVAAQLPALYGIPITGAVEHVRPEPLFRYTLRLRQKHGLRLIPADQAMIGLFRALRRGEIVVLPMDRNLADNTREVLFFGKPTLLPDGPVQIGLRTGAALVPALISRCPDDSLRVHISPEIELPRTGDWEADVCSGMQRVVAVVEQHIARYPDQWLVASPVWPMEEDS